MSVMQDCLKTAEGRQAVEIGKNAARDLSAVIGPLTPEQCDPLFAVIYQMLLEDAIKKERDPAKRKELQSFWWQAHGAISRRGINTYLDWRVGND